MAAAPYKIVPTDARIVTLRTATFSHRRFLVLLRGTAQSIGMLEEARRNTWFAYLPNGVRTEFTLPSRKQAAEWLFAAGVRVGLEG